MSGVAGNTILAIIVGSVFLNLPETTDSFTRRAVLLFYSIVINACISAFEVSPKFFNNSPIGIVSKALLMSNVSNILGSGPYYVGGASNRREAQRI